VVLESVQEVALESVLAEPLVQVAATATVSIKENIPKVHVLQ
jgi:hypothetical protein